MRMRMMMSCRKNRTTISTTTRNGCDAALILPLVHGFGSVFSAPKTSHHRHDDDVDAGVHCHALCRLDHGDGRTHRRHDGLVLVVEHDGHSRLVGTGRADDVHRLDIVVAAVAVVLVAVALAIVGQTHLVMAAVVVVDRERHHVRHGIAPPRFEGDDEVD